MDYLLIGIFSVIIIALLAGIVAYNSHKKNAARLQKKTSNLQPVRCPVCQSELFVGEQLVSKVYRPMKVPDQLMTIQGCPHCYPKCEPGVHYHRQICLGPDDQLLSSLPFPYQGLPGKALPTAAGGTS